MEQKQIQFLATTPNELISDLLVAIKPYLKEISDKNLAKSDEDALLTREETAKLLSINLSTLWKFTKAGILKAYSLPETSRVYYKKLEVLNAFKPLL